MERILLNGIWKLYGKDQKGAGDDIYTLNSVTGRLVHYAVCASTLGKIGGKCLYSRVSKNSRADCSAIAFFLAASLLPERKLSGMYFNKFLSLGLTFLTFVVYYY